MPLATFAILIASSVAGAPLGAGNDWPQYNGAGSDRRSSEELGLRAFPEAGPPERWRQGSSSGFSSLTVADGRAFTLVSLDGEEVCAAYEAGNGQPIWSRPLGEVKYDGGGGAGTADNGGGDGPRSTPAVVGDTVYVFDAQLELLALDAATGEVRWRQDLIADFGGRNIRWQNAASPLVVEGRVFVAGGGEGQSLLAFDAASGEVIWKAHDERMTHATPIHATLGGVEQVIHLCQSGLVAVVPEDGTVLWRQPFDYRVSSAASPVVHGDVVYVSAGYGVGAAAFELSREGDEWSSELLWRKPNKLQNHWSTPVCVDGHLYGMFSFKKYGTGPMKCVELRTGEEKWSQEGFGPGNCIVVGDVVVALSDRGEVVLVSARDDEYEELARADVLKGKCWSSPSFADGSLYVRSTVEAACFDLSGAEGTKTPAPR